ncbi:hypothetical protein Trco_005580 [Trichoderma cornu-damae]|uniref:Uncharacterized protein n=1 Tax=Trichoderma cornu-damae TaxID=654480 RepID=A0A9P8TVW2_9HYPO|nr:hypothetical protein Trco_005580 [Trichoderma cornu-damae]
MDGNSAFVEFYVTCNPPLLPQGVEHIIESTKSVFDQGELAEILYEPDIPWFKCITTFGYREPVAEAIQDLLVELMNMEVEPIAFDPLEVHDAGDGLAHPDVAMKTSEPRMMPWMVYKSLGKDIYDNFVDYQFPEIMAALPFKSTWRGLQNSTGASIETLLSSFCHLSKSENAPLTAEDFALLNDCQISYNMRESLVYIGSFKSMAVVDKAIQRLEAMLDLLVCISIPPFTATTASPEASNARKASKPDLISHCILPEGPAAVRLTYRWMSHIGLDKATFAVQSSNSAIADEQKLLLNAAVLRTEKLDRHGRWIPDDTIYPRKDVPQSEPSHVFDAFKGYAPRSKAGFSDMGASPSIYGLRQDRGETDTLIFGLEGPRSLRRLPPALIDVDATAVRNFGIAESEILYTSRDSIAEGFLIDCEEGTESVTSQSGSVLADHHVQEELLISFTESEEGSSCGSEAIGSTNQSTTAELRQGSEDVMRLEQFERSDDLIWLGDGSQAQQPPPGMDVAKIFGDGPARDSRDSLPTCQTPEAENGHSTGPAENNPLEAQEQTSTGISSDGLVRFGLMQERPKDFFQTMNQRGGRAITRSTSSALSPVGADGYHARQAPGARWNSPSSTGTRSDAEVSLQHNSIVAY